MRNDFKRISNFGLTPKIVSEETEYCIVIEENTTSDCQPIKNEGFSIKTDGNKIRIFADGYLGTLWGIYTFCEKYLGVDPCYLFNDLEIVKRDFLEISDIDISEQPKSFGFRGVFINDEDLLTGWKDGGGIRYLNFRWYGLTVEQSVIEMVIETILRLRLNLIIPASFLDIDNPPEKLLADCVAKRGIYLSQHHLEPLGVSAFTFENFCKKYNKTGEFSYMEYPEIMEEVWSFYAKKWAQYDNVVWQIGLRGKGDRPVWQDGIPTYDDMEKYGKFISKAYQKQYEIVMKVTEGKAKHFTSTLWMEGSALTEKGYLEFPENTVMVFADTGPNQMYGKEYYTVPRLENKNYGIYYHLQYYGSGPHLVPQTGLDKLYYNLKLAYDNHDNSYCIMNISNVREFVFELGAYAQLMWNIDDFSKEEYLDNYCKKYNSYADDAKKLIKAYFDNLPEIDVHNLTMHHSKYFNYSFNKPDGIKNFVVKDGNVLGYGQKIIGNFHQEFDIPLYDEIYNAIKAVIPIYDEICKGFELLAQSVSEPLKKHTEVKWLCYAKTLSYIYKWYVNLYEAKQYCDLYESEKMKASLNTAAKCLEDYIQFRKCAEYGIFKNWYRGDLKMNVKQRLYDTKQLLGQTPDY